MRLLLDHCVIHVSDRRRSDVFYREILGAKIVEDDGGRAAYRFGDQQLNVHAPCVDAGGLVARLPVQPGNSDLCFVWPGTIEEAVAHLRSKRIPIEAGPVSRRGGRDRGVSVYFRDPDGSLLEFISYAGAAGRRSPAARGR